MVKVKLNGLNIVRARGKWYVYHRDSKEILLKGFEGSRADLVRRLAEPDLIAAYNRHRTRDLKQIYPEGTLGALVQWFEKSVRSMRSSPTQPRRTIRPRSFICAPSSTHTCIDHAAGVVWGPRQVREGEMAALCRQDDVGAFIDVHSGREARKDDRESGYRHRQGAYGRSELQPRMGGGRVGGCYRARAAGDRNSDDAGPSCRLTAGRRSPSVQWKHYQDDVRSESGKCFRVVVRKNKEQTWIPVTPDLRAFLDGLDRTSLNIATRTDGTLWKDEKHMQTAVSHFLRGIEATTAVESGRARLFTACGLATRQRRAGTAQTIVRLLPRSAIGPTGWVNTTPGMSPLRARVIRAFEARKKP